MVDLRINGTLLTGAVGNRTYRRMKARLETAPTPTYRDRSRPAPIISLPRFIEGIETEGRKCLFIFGVHHNSSGGAGCPAYGFYCMIS